MKKILFLAGMMFVSAMGYAKLTDFGGSGGGSGTGGVTALTAGAGISVNNGGVGNVTITNTFAAAGAPGGDSIKSPTMTVINGDTSGTVQNAISFQVNTTTNMFMASDGKLALGPSVSSATSLMDIQGGSLTIRGTNAGLMVFSTGTASGITLNVGGVPGAGAQTETGGLQVQKLSGPPGTLAVFRDSVTDQQGGYGIVEIWSDNPMHNDPDFWIHETSTQSGPVVRYDSPAPDVEWVNKSTDNSLGLGKWEEGMAFQGVNFQFNSRARGNGTFQRMLELIPTQLGGGIQLYPATGLNGNNTTSTNTAPVQWFTTDTLHTVGIQGPQASTASWNWHLPATFENNQQVMYQCTGAPGYNLCFSTALPNQIAQMDSAGNFIFGAIPTVAAGSGILATDSTTISGQMNFTNTTSMTVGGGQTALKIIAVSATKFPLIIGQNSAGTEMGIGFKDGSVSTHAYITTISNTGVMAFGIRGKDLLTLDAGATGGVGINNTAPSASLHVSSAAGATSALLRVSTGSTNLFEVTGTSINATAVPMTVSSLTVNNGGLSMNGVGPGQLKGAGELQLDGNGDNTNEIKVNAGSVTITGDLAFGATVQTPFVPNRFVSIASSTYAVDFPTMTDRGLPHFDVQHSSGGNSGTGTLWLPKNLIAGATPQLDLFNSVVNAADAGTEIYGIAIATVAGGVHVQNPIFQSTVAFTVSGPAGATKSVKSASGIILNGWNQYTGTGNMEILIKVFKLGGTATNNSWVEGGIISWKQQE